jgi:hypothetical protein
MSRVYLTDDPRVLEFLTQARLPAFRLTSQEMPDLRNGDVIVLGRPAQAKTDAFNLASRGVSKIRLKYVEIDAISSLSEAIKRPKHLYWDDAGPLSEVQEEEDFPVYESGFPFLDPNLKWRFPELGIVAGPYGSGKSILAQMLATRFIGVHGEAMGCRALLCSWEDLATEIRRNVCAHAKHFGNGVADMLDRMHYVRRAVTEDRLISWYMDLVRFYVETFNARFFVLDPWNELDHQKGVRQNETEYVLDMMKEFRRLVDELKIILIIVTHVPSKFIRGDGAIEPFRIGHAFGSTQFAAKADRGFCVVRSRSLGADHMVVRFDKVKVERLMGRKGTVALKYDEDRHAVSYDKSATEQVRDIWKG